MENAAIAGAKHPQNAAIEGYVLNSGILPLYRVEAVPSDFDAAKPDVPLFRAPLYRATYCTAIELLSEVFTWLVLVWFGRQRGMKTGLAAALILFRRRGRSTLC